MLPTSLSSCKAHSFTESGSSVTAQSSPVSSPSYLISSDKFLPLVVSSAVAPSDSVSETCHYQWWHAMGAGNALERVYALTTYSQELYLQLECSSSPLLANPHFRVAQLVAFSLTLRQY